MRCYNCGLVGHIARVGRSKGKGKDGGKGYTKGKGKAGQQGRGTAVSSAATLAELQESPRVEGTKDTAGHVLKIGHKFGMSIGSRRHSRG